MNATKTLVFQLLKLFLFWILLFDFQRILFSIHNWTKFSDVSWGDWFLSFFYSIRLDMASAAYLMVLPVLILIIRFYYPAKWNKRLFFGVLMLEAAVVSMIHAGEINAYPEWNHKLTSRVFMHLSNPDEVVRTADYSMTVWFAIYSILEVVFAWRMYQWLLRREMAKLNWNWYYRAPLSLGLYCVVVSGLFITARGGLQQIPINIDSAYHSNNHVANDLAVNSFYYFGNSYLLYNKANIDEIMPKVDKQLAIETVKSWYDYPKEHDNYILKNKRPNLVFVIMESWAAEAVSCLSDRNKNTTKNFDKMAEEGILFTNLYSTGHTSEIGNSSIFSGNPAIPGISISLQPEKHRKLRSLNQDVQDWGYSTGYIFSGDLKYGNIGGYFMDHGFQDVKDENDFPDGLQRGKLNYFDEALYELLIDRINGTKGPFMHCAFTGSTHSPYDFPKRKLHKWEGEEQKFMNSIIYADDCIKDFIDDCRKEEWFDNTLFVFIADHGHAAPGSTDPGSNDFYRIPVLFWGEPLKEEYRGKRIDKVASQTDIAATLLYQMGGDISQYPWSKDLLNPESPEFAFHTIIRGYGWVSPKGMLAYQTDHKAFFINTYDKKDFDEELKNCHYYLTSVYEDYKNL
jgi:phosphoglycerol transferase MdoB-like AlkP superfamily enzyme